MSLAPARVPALMVATAASLLVGSAAAAAEPPEVQENGRPSELDQLPLRFQLSLGFAALGEYKDAPVQALIGSGLRLETRILSWLLQRRQGLTAYDALSFDELNGPSLGLAPIDAVLHEGLVVGAAYELLPGFRSPAFAAFAGLRARLEYCAFSASYAGGFSFPLVLRLEIRTLGERRVILQGWASAFGARRSLGSEIDVGVHPHAYLSLSLDRTTARAHLDETLGGPRTVDGAVWMGLASLRVGSFY